MLLNDVFYAQRMNVVRAKKIVKCTTRQLLYYLLLHLVFISYFKIVANRNKDLINNRNQVNFLKTFFCKRKKRSFVTFHIRATHATRRA